MPAEPLLRIVVYLLTLLVVLAFCVFALLRAARRYRESLLSKPGRPTPTPDIWGMHRLPDDADAKPESGAGGPS